MQCFSGDQVAKKNRNVKNSKIKKGKKSDKSNKKISMKITGKRNSNANKTNKTAPKSNGLMQLHMQKLHANGMDKAGNDKAPNQASKQSVSNKPISQPISNQYSSLSGSSSSSISSSTKPAKPSVPEVKAIVRVKYFESVPADVHFDMADGTRLTSLLELSDALLRMSDDIFYYHVRGDANDFAKWIRDVFSDHKLAQMIALCHTKEEANHYLLRYLVEKLLAE